MGEGEEIAGAVAAGSGILIEVVAEDLTEEGHHVEDETVEIMARHHEENLTLTYPQPVVDGTKEGDHRYHALGRLPDQSLYRDLHQDDEVGQLQNLGHHHLVDVDPDRQTEAPAGGVAGDAREVQKEDPAVDLLRLQNPAPHPVSGEELRLNL